MARVMCRYQPWSATLSSWSGSVARHGLGGGLVKRGGHELLYGEGGQLAELLDLRRQSAQRGGVEQRDEPVGDPPGVDATAFRSAPWPPGWLFRLGHAALVALFGYFAMVYLGLAASRLT